MFEGDSGKTKSERSNSISLRSERSNSLSKSSSGYGTLRDQPSETTYDSDEVGFKLNRLWPHVLSVFAGFSLLLVSANASLWFLMR